MTRPRLVPIQDVEEAAVSAARRGYLRGWHDALRSAQGHLAELAAAADALAREEEEKEEKKP